MSEDNPNDDLLTSSAAAALSTLLGRPLTPSSIRLAARKGALPFKETTTGLRLFSRDSIARFATKPRPFPRRSSKRVPK